MSKRLLYFFASNIAIIAVISIVAAIISKLTGFDIGGTGIASIAVYSLIVGFTGAFMSLAISRWMAKRTYDITLIDQSNVMQASTKPY